MTTSDGVHPAPASKRYGEPSLRPEQVKKRVSLLFEEFGAPERSRTPNPQIRSLVLYPVELRARTEQEAGCAGSHNYSSRMQQGKADHRGGRWPVAPGKTT